MEATDNRPFPWQQGLWAGLVERLRAGTLPHALLFSGPPGMGKRRLAEAFAQSLLCEAPGPDGAGCNRCKGCQLYRAGNHPDLVRLEPAEEGKDITIDGVRSLGDSQALKAHSASHKVVIIEPAERMNANAANALLKTLEEPTPGTVLLLCTSRPMALLPTIRSRCQAVMFRPGMEAEAARRWLAEQVKGKADPELLLRQGGGAPLAALALAEEGGMEARLGLLDGLEQLAAGRTDPLAMAAACQKQGVEPALAGLYGWVADLVRIKAVPEEAPLAGPQLAPRLQALAERLDLKWLCTLLDRLQEAIRLARGRVNDQLLLEAILITWTQGVSAAGRTEQR